MPLIRNSLIHKLKGETTVEQKDVIVEKEGEIVFLTLNHPGRGNVLSEKLYSEICRNLEELNADDEVRLIIIKGAGDNFSMGGDVARIVSLDKSGKRNYFLGLVEVYKKFHTIDKLSIAMVHGYATGAGMGIALSCDLAVASEDARFGATAINAGLFCLNTTGVMLPRIVGHRKALEMGLTGDVISAREAERLGLVNMVVPRERLQAATMELARKLLSKNPVSLVVGRKNFYACADMKYDEGLEHSAEMFSVLAASEEAEEGMKAFLGKREPSYKRAGSQ